MINKINRREFLKYSVLFPASAYFFPGNTTAKYSLLNKRKASNSQKLGRVLFDGVQTHALPATDSEVQETLSFNDIIYYRQEIKVNSVFPKNEIWFQLTDDGYINAKFIQPVADDLNEVVSEVSPSGQLAEVTVPYTTAVVNQWNNNRPESQEQLFFFGSTHWVYGLGKDEENNFYYLVKEDRWDDSYYVNATHMRLVGDDELAPISAGIEENRKRIQINLKDQYLIAYEDEKAVFISAISSGQLTGSVDLTTPTGDFLINYKRPSRHMVHSDRMGINDNELYGVPWVSYFTDSGIALHGTYWHNNFSQPNSHGCINMPIPAARWLYLWTLPIVPPREKKFVANRGTHIEIS